MVSIAKVFEKYNPTISFEFFPPKSEKSSKDLFDTIHDLTPLNPAFVSVTYGAGGSARGLTRDLVIRLHKETELNVVAHLTCVGATKVEINDIVADYYDAGIRNIMALRGDPVEGSGSFKTVDGGFKHASEMVSFIKEKFPDIGIGVAGFPEGHPECPNRLQEIEYLKRKVDAGADYICTQLFFNNEDFYDFSERCDIAGINVPIIAGLMPITSIKGMKRMCDLALGARVPAKLLKGLNRADDDYVEKVGIHWASEQARDLLDNNVRGIHFYTLNKSNVTQEIYKSLGIKSSTSLQS